jgi:hypothetical protein
MVAPQNPSVRRLLLVLAGAVVAVTVISSAGQAAAAGPCGPPVVNPVACENSKPGDPPSDWQINGVGDSTIQGFATSMSVNVGQTVNFKIKTTAKSYHFDILRLGYYGGDGARIIASGLKPSATLPQTQPSCLTNSSTGLVDCGNWATSASWTVPSDAVSGLYIAHLVRDDTGGESQILFVVRNDASHSDLLLQTSDATWEAYNAYGGNSLYSCTVACPPGNPQAYKAAYAVSYNRPFDGTLAQDGGQSDPFYAEYQLIRFIEANGYDVSYTSSSDVDASGALLKNHKVFISSGHDEYWSKGMRDNVEAARDAGVNLAFFSGNEVFWKTRWAASSDGSNTPYRTLITYKETHFDSVVDPQDPPTWTGTWVDPRFSPPGDGGRPPNSLTGQFFLVNSGTSDIKVPAAYGKLRFWRNTQVANLAAGQTLTLDPSGGTLGYEWDSDLDNGFRPNGIFDLSSTTVTGVQTFDDYGSNLTTGPATHNLTLYRAPSGALVFGAGTVQWSWGLDNTNAWGGAGPSAVGPDRNMQQATVNLFADMGAQPATLMSGLVAATASTDTTAPTSAITSPTNGASLSDGTKITISGTASDTGGGVVAGVEVSTDGGATWHPATGTTSWSYSWVPNRVPTAKIMSRAVDDSGNIETPSSGITVSVSCPCSMWGNATPVTTDSGDTSATTVGVKFTSDVAGTISGIRFWKVSTNTGTHVGNLWTAGGTLLASATFTGESTSGWQQVNFSTPVSINANTTYVAGYFAPKGHYAATTSYFFNPPPTGGNILDSPPLHAAGGAGNGPDGLNGVYAYGAGSTFPSNSYLGESYWVDVLFNPAAPPAPPGQATGVSATAGPGSATVSWSAPSSGGAPTSYKVTPYIGSVAQTTKPVTGSPLPTSTTVSGLTPGQSYTFTVQASNSIGDGPASGQSNAVSPTAVAAPGAPTGVAATASAGAAQVSWTPPTDNGGSAITGYTITPYIGSTAQPTTPAGASSTSASVTGLTNNTTYTFTVKATNAVGTGPESTPSNAVTPQITDTIFGTSTPTTVDSGDGNPVELGVKFTSDVGGTVNGVRFYKASTNTGTHVGSLWTTTGTLLASATFSNESASGWQQVLFSSPVTITPNTTYIAGYFAPNGRYSITEPGFTSAVNSPPLHAVANGTSPNGVYVYGAASTFPTSSFNASNYFVDVVFAPTPAVAPGQVTGVSATAGTGSATVKWSAPTSGGAPTSYKVTPFIGSTAQAVKAVAGTPPATTTTISGLTAGQSYTFTVQASNASGDGPVSAQSNAVTPIAATAPSAPTGVTATASAGAAQVGWAAPAGDGGSAITGYTVTPYIGSTAQTAVPAGASATSASVTGLTNGTTYTFTVKATNAIGTGPESTPSSPVTPQNLVTIFGSSTPAEVDSGDANPVELGVKFTSDVAGTVTGIRFYKASTNTGTHIGNLWTAGGTPLASATFTNESASGWQQVLFANPVTISPNTTYVASYFAPNGDYSDTVSGFNTAVDSPPLHAVANGTSPNGLFSYNPTSTFPVNTWNASNYFVDVIFAPSN